MKKEELVGPRAHNRKEQELTPQEVRLADGRPLYHALLENPDALVVLPDKAREAQQKLSEIIATNPEKALKCQGKTFEEAKAILESAE